jgi:hypothetical protein
VSNSNTLHILPAEDPHGEVHVVGDLEGLGILHAAIGRALSSNRPEFANTFTADGEGYVVVVVPTSNAEMKEAVLPYASVHASTGKWPQLKAGDWDRMRAHLAAPGFGETTAEPESTVTMQRDEVDMLLGIERRARSIADVAAKYHADDPGIAFETISVVDVLRSVVDGVGRQPSYEVTKARTDAFATVVRHKQALCIVSLYVGAESAPPPAPATPPPVLLWLDDVRSPPDERWTVAKTAEEARKILLAGPVEAASLDHDLGICPRCTPGQVHEGANIVVIASLDPICGNGCRCACHETGYDLAVWMAETGRWPKYKPASHSANPVGKQRILAVVERYWRAPESLTLEVTAHDGSVLHADDARRFLEATVEGAPLPEDLRARIFGGT